MRLLLILFVLWPGFALADPDLPASVKARILKAPDRWLAEMTRLVAGFGGPAGLTSEGIDRHVAVERAAARANALRDLLSADLDGDGAVSAEEGQEMNLVLSARGRGAWALRQAAADQDGNGTLVGAEIVGFAQAQALDRFSDRRADGLRAVLAFDADGDGAVSIAELLKGVATLVDGA
ncbi:hypothetical protein [Gemmobacter denitrificans]|uniref:EF-hand domain-containing protein n=1 Tax=Gemmobacter denitrificans TaxID=3123040 RepID=A0ABU8BYF1_9RHOB